jgi:Arc/MetJ-type ribon-helix-helix transcriptional regulator
MRKLPKTERTQINVHMPKELDRRIEAAARAQYTTKSDFIRGAVVERIEKVEAKTAA